MKGVIFLIGERLKDIRRDNGDTQADLARKLNVSKFTIQSWEQNKSEPSHSMLIKLCRLYQVSSDFLLGITDNDPIFYHVQQKTFQDEDRLLLREFVSFLKSRQK